MGRDEDTVAILARANAELQSKLAIAHEGLQSRDQQLELASAQIQSLTEGLQKSERENQRISEILEVLQRRLYGPRAEKIDPRQLLLFTQGEEPAPETTPPHVLEAPDDEEVVVHKKRVRGPRIPSDLPKERIVLPVDESEKTCPKCQVERQCIGEDIQEKLDYIPARFRCKQYVREKYACPKCQEGVVRAPAVVTPIEKGIPDVHLLTQVVVAKYEDHLPLERQSKMYERAGVHLSVSTLCDWIGSVASALLPIYQAQKLVVLSDSVLQTDETPVTVVQNYGPKDKQRRISAFLWPYLSSREVVFDFRLSRSRDGPSTFLEGFRGYLQSDGYSGYHQVHTVEGIVAVGCWAHVRRRFFDALPREPQRALLPFALIRLLYSIEREGKDLTPEARKALRQEKARPVLEQLYPSLKQLEPVVLPKSTLGQAVGYALGQWKSLVQYLEDGRVAIDNNAVERVIRPVAIGRKNWLFAGSPEGGRRAAILYSVIASCKLHGLSPLDYLDDVLRRVQETPAERMNELIPSRWKALVRS